MGNSRAGILTVKRFSSVRFFLDLNPDNRAGRIRLRGAKVGGIAIKSEVSRATRLPLPAGLASGNYFLVACADTTNRIKESNEKNQCRISGQSINVSQQQPHRPAGPRGTGNEATIDRFTLPIGRATDRGLLPRVVATARASWRRREEQPAQGVRQGRADQHRRRLQAHQQRGQTR